MASARESANADWVVLSACNTAEGDKPGAEALSGLARAFFYAGARALMVSHFGIMFLAKLSAPCSLPSLALVLRKSAEN